MECDACWKKTTIADDGKKPLSMSSLYGMWLTKSRKVSNSTISKLTLILRAARALLWGTPFNSSQVRSTDFTSPQHSHHHYSILLPCSVALIGIAAALHRSATSLSTSFSAVFALSTAACCLISVTTVIVDAVSVFMFSSSHQHP